MYAMLVSFMNLFACCGEVANKTDKFHSPDYFLPLKTTGDY